MSRTRIVASALVMWIALQLSSSPAAVGRGDATAPRFKAVAFDYFVLFDPDSVVSQAEELFPGKGRQLTTLWRNRQFEYTWLRSVAHRYIDFSAVTRDALTYAAKAINVELTPDDERRLLDAYLRLTPWPDTVETLQTLKRSGVRAIARSNFSPPMLRANAEYAHIADLVDAFVRTDENRTYRPDPRAYQLGVDRLHLAKSATVFAASAGWRCRRKVVRLRRHPASPVSSNSCCAGQPNVQSVSATDGPVRARPVWVRAEYLRADRHYGSEVISWDWQTTRPGSDTGRLSRCD